MRRKTTTRPYRNLVGLLAINILSIFVQSLSFAQIVPHYVIQLESARKESQGHFSAFSYGETFKWDHNCSHLFFLEIVLFFVAHSCIFYFLLPIGIFVAHRYGELVASHPWKAIIACLAITIAGGSGLLRSILEKSNIEYWRNMEEILMTLVWTSQGNIGRKNQLKNKPIIHFFCLGFMKKATQPAWSYQEDRNSEKISTGRMKISQER